MAKSKKASSNALEVQNAAKTLFANIRFMSPDAPLKSIALTSSVPNEGKSTTSVELARAIATSGAKTLIVECDMRRRSLANILGVRCPNGAYAVLSGRASLDSAIVATKTSNLYFLDVEPNIPNPADIISSHAYKNLTQQLANRFDYVIYDTPPVGTFVDAAILSQCVDGVVLVVKPGMTKREEVLHAYEQLQKANANVIGTCATFCEGTGSEYYYAYYTEDGKRARPSRDGAANNLNIPTGHAAASHTQPRPAAPAPAPAAAPAAAPANGREAYSAAAAKAKARQQRGQ